MPSPFVEDLSVFFADFAVPAVIGVSTTISVIFDRAYIAQLAGRVDSSGPMCLGRTSDLAAVHDGDPITVDGVLWTVVGEPQPDGTGLSILQLRG